MFGMYAYADVGSVAVGNCECAGGPLNPAPGVAVRAKCASMPFMFVHRLDFCILILDASNKHDGRIKKDIQANEKAENVS